jgi:arylsulfatase
LRKKTIIGGAVVLVAAVVAAGVWLARSRPEGAPPPSNPLDDGGCAGCNVLLITFETLRADHLKCYGYSRDIAPNVCAFGKTGLLFEKAYTPAPITVPALYAMMSGELAANEDQAELFAHWQEASSRSIAVRLAQKGYATAGITDHKGLGDSSRKRPKTAALGQGFAELLNFGEGKHAKTSERTAAAVERWLGEHRSDRFFLWTHLFDPHYDWIPDAAAARAFGFDADDCGRITWGMEIEAIHAIEASLTPAETACLAALYHAEVHETDALVGRILARLDALGLATRTIVIFAGDHGEELSERGHIGHELTVYDELLHVPLIVRNPRSGARGRPTEPISTVAVHDYVLAAVAGQRLGRLPPVVARTFHYYGGRSKGAPGALRTPPNDFALVRGDLKLVHTPRTGSTALYDRSTDPGERRDLFAGHPAGAELKRALDAWLREQRSTADPASNATIRAFQETAERLENLGYQ